MTPAQRDQVEQARRHPQSGLDEALNKRRMRLVQEILESPPETFSAEFNVFFWNQRKNGKVGL